MQNLTLYKYRPDDIYTIKLLCEQRLHFSHPFDFNDPMDCRPPCSSVFTEEQILSYVGRTAPKALEQVKKNLATIVQSVNSDMDEFKREVEKIFNELYLCCFSYNTDSPLMWAHYANNHTGLSLGFDSNIGGTFKTNGVMRVVNYVQNRRILDATSEAYMNQIVDILSEKYEHWRYEEEVRILKTPDQMIIGGEVQNSFDKSALVAMFFGLRMPKERQDFYKLLCKQCGLDRVKFFKMTLPTDGTYHLIPKQI